MRMVNSLCIRGERQASRIPRTGLWPHPSGTPGAVHSGKRTAGMWTSPCAGVSRTGQCPARGMGQHDRNRNFPSGPSQSLGADPGGVTRCSRFFFLVRARSSGAWAQMFSATTRASPDSPAISSDTTSPHAAATTRTTCSPVRSARSRASSPSTRCTPSSGNAWRACPPTATSGTVWEYNALLAAGVFDFETGLRIVQKRGELMAAASGGGMTAATNTPADRLLEVLGADGVEGVEVAAHNTDTQVVIAGGWCSPGRPRLPAGTRHPLRPTAGRGGLPLARHGISAHRVRGISPPIHLRGTLGDGDIQCECTTLRGEHDFGDAVPADRRTRSMGRKRPTPPRS